MEAIALVFMARFFRRVTCNVQLTGVNKDGCGNVK